jgi:hypothetical protein
MIMTETISLPDGQQVESPHIPRRQTDGAARQAIEDATSHLRDRARKIRQNPEAPGRQRHIQDCVDKILAKVDSEPAEG